MRRVSETLVSIIVLVVVVLLSGCPDMLGGEDDDTDGDGGGFAAVDALSLQTAPLSATLTWTDPDEVAVDRIKITMSPAITGVSQPVYIDPGVETYTVTWPEWPGENYEFTFVVIDTDNVEYDATTIEVQPGVPERALAPLYLQEIVAYPLEGSASVAWGAGYDSIRGVPLTNSAFSIDPENDISYKTGSGESAAKIAFVETTSAIDSFVQESMSVGVGVSGTYGPVSASVSVDVSESRSLGRQIKTSNTNLIIHKKVRGPSFYINAADADSDRSLEFDASRDPLDLSPAAFYNLYGDRFAYEVLCGYDIFILLEIETQSEAQQEVVEESVGVSASAGAYGVSVSTSVNQDSLNSLSTEIGEENIEVTTEIFGWTAGPSIEGTSVADILTNLDDYARAYADAINAPNAKETLWSTGTVEVRFKDYFSQLSNFVPTYPNLELGDSTDGYRQLVLDHRNARRLRARVYGWYGEPDTWSSLYMTETLNTLNPLNTQINDEIDRLTASLEEARAFSTAAEFDSWTPAAPSFTYDDIVYEEPVVIPGGNPPSGYSIFIPTNTELEETTPYSGDSVEGSYNADTYLMGVGALSGASAFQSEVTSGEFIAYLPSGYDYYIYWKDLSLDGSGSFTIAGTQYTTTSGDRTVSCESLGSSIRLSTTASRSRPMSWSTSKVYIYRKSNSITDPGGGGTTIGPFPTPVFP